MAQNTIEIGGNNYPAKWAICPSCDGNGKHSKHLGDFTAREFEDCFPDRDDQHYYFSGGYDRTCDDCGGAGKVLDVHDDMLTVEQRMEIEEYYEFQRESAAERRAEQAMGC